MKARTAVNRRSGVTVVEVEHEDMHEARRQLRSTYDRVRTELHGRELRKLDTLYERIGPQFHGTRSGRPIEYVYCSARGLY
jgi:hypothetical protein